MHLSHPLHSTPNSTTYLHEASANIVIGQVEDGRVEDGARVVDLLDLQTVEERLNLQHSQQRRLGGAHSLASRDQLHVALQTRTRAERTP